jgi:hypothetical protein
MCVDAADVKQELAVARMPRPADVAHKRLLAWSEHKIFRALLKILRYSII